MKMATGLGQPFCALLLPGLLDSAEHLLWGAHRWGCPGFPNRGVLPHVQGTPRSPDHPLPSPAIANPNP